ncbi:MAG TPA: hypothetical protein VMV33_13005 [Rhodocyclaceae bacterium]|nr:hypothetical protein [Rhodocyclaceae bacterium]
MERDDYASVRTLRRSRRRIDGNFSTLTIPLPTSTAPSAAGLE